MFAAILILLLLGLMLILLEAVVPGGVLGVIGCLLLGVSAYLCFSHYSTGIATVYLIGCLILAGGAGIAAFLFIMKRAELKPPESARSLSHHADAPIGTAGRVVKTLNPTGTIEIDGKRFMARSAFIQEEIPAGSYVTVTEIDGSYLVVCSEDKTAEA